MLRCAADDFGKDEIAGFGIAEIGDRPVAARFLVDRAQPELLAVVARLGGDDAEDHFLCPLELFHQVRDMALTTLLGAREDAIADAERALAPTLDDAQHRRRRSRLPRFGRRDRLIVVDSDDAQHGNLGHAAADGEGAARRKVDQPVIGHVVKQRLELDLFLPFEAEFARDLPLSCGLVARFDKRDDLLDRRHSVRCALLLGHLNTPGR